MRADEILVRAGVAVVASVVGFVVGTRVAQRRLIRRIGDDAQEWLDSRSTTS